MKMIFNDPLLNLTVPEGPSFSGQDDMETSYRNDIFEVLDGFLATLPSLT